MEFFTQYELMPLHDSRASFYGKAKVWSFRDGAAKTLVSYDTPVCWMDATGDVHRLRAGWSSTTGRHVVEFCRQATPVGERTRVVRKKEWEALPVEPAPDFMQ